MDRRANAAISVTIGNSPPGPPPAPGPPTPPPSPGAGPVDVQLTAMPAAQKPPSCTTVHSAQTFKAQVRGPCEALCPAPRRAEQRRSASPNASRPTRTAPSGHAPARLQESQAGAARLQARLARARALPEDRDDEAHAVHDGAAPRRRQVALLHPAQRGVHEHPARARRWLTPSPRGRGGRIHKPGVPACVRAGGAGPPVLNWLHEQRHASPARPVTPLAWCPLTCVDGP